MWVSPPVQEGGLALTSMGRSEGSNKEGGYVDVWVCPVSGSIGVSVEQVGVSIQW